MQNKNLTRWLWLFILATLIVGCGAPAIPPTPTPLPTLSPTPSPTSTPIPPTETPVPTDTPTPMPTQSLSSMVETLKAAAQGSGVAEATAYDPGRSGIHPILFVSPADEVYEWNSSLPDSWRPLYVSQTELIASISYRSVEINKTRYKGQGSGWIYVSRIRLDTVVTLYEAQTGVTVDYIVFNGGEPMSFPSTLPYGTQYLYGDAVAYETVIDWLTSYVEP